MLRLLPLLLILAACAEPSPPDLPTQGRWNVLFLVMDTTRADRLSLLGNSRPTTPHLIEFAREAVVYTNAWSPSSWTAPAHASLFTGLRPEHHGLAHGARIYLDEGPATLAELFREAGYATSCLTNNSFITPMFGLTRGFDHIETIHDHGEYVGPTAVWTHREALRQARSAARTRRPFFIFVNDMEPHLPYAPPDDLAVNFLPPGTDDRTRRRAEAFDKLEVFESLTGYREIGPEEWAVLSALYDAEIASLDREISALLTRMRDEGLLERTVVVIAGDHGENLGEHGLASHYFSLHRTLLHVPLLIRYPDGWRAGTRVNSVVRLEDLFPTLLQVCGLESPESDGRAIHGDPGRRIALGYYGRPPVKTLMKGYNPRNTERFEPGIRSVYDGRHHLIRYDDGRTELYDVEADPLETQNLAREEPGKVAELARQIED